MYAYAESYGGATLSAILITESSTHIVNIGDSRVYAEPKAGIGQIKRLTIDDSMAEIVGGSGRELLQFIGMGESIKITCTPVLEDLNRLILTSDGVHFVSQDTLGALLSNASDLNIAASRINTLVRWSGAPDNATLAVLSLPELRKQLTQETDAAVELTDPFGDFHFGWWREDVQAQDRLAPSAQNVRYVEK